MAHNHAMDVFRGIFEQFATRHAGPYASLLLIGTGPSLPGGCIYMGSPQWAHIAAVAMARAMAVMQIAFGAAAVVLWLRSRAVWFRRWVYLCPYLIAAGPYQV